MENQEKSRTVVLEPEISEAFPTTESVNEALKTLMQKSKRPKLTAEQVRDQMNAIYDGTLSEEDERLLQGIQKHTRAIAEPW